VERLTGHEEVQELLGAYALDAVEPDEAAAIERHLPTCPRCRIELADHREVAALMGYAGADAPSGVWDRIIASLEEPPPALNLTRAPTAHPAGTAVPNEAASTPDPLDLDAIGGRWGPQTPAPIHARGPEEPGGPPGDGQVVPISQGRGTGPGRGRSGDRPRRSVPMRFMVAIATVAAVLVAALGVEVGRLQVNKPQPANLSALGALAYRAADADPSARHLTLTSPGGVHTVRAVILPDGATYLGPGNLAVLPSSETYQMWGIVDGSRISLGVIGDNPTYQAFDTPAVADTIAMTVEARGGVVISSKTPVVAGVVPA
jgi:hypothetical protein